MKGRRKSLFYVFSSYIIRGGIVTKKERLENPTCPSELGWSTWFRLHEMQQVFNQHQIIINRILLSSSKKFPSIYYQIKTFISPRKVVVTTLK
jgi:hypothetical protein